MNTTHTVEMTDGLREQLRERFTTVLVTTNNTERTMHIPVEDSKTPLCERRKPDKDNQGQYHECGHWVPKELVVFPKGWNDWCKGCVGEYING